MEEGKPAVPLQYGQCGLPLALSSITGEPQYSGGRLPVDREQDLNPNVRQEYTNLAWTKN